MSHTDRVTRASNQGITAPIEPLEGRVLLSGGGHEGGDDDRFRRPAIQRDQAIADFNGDKKADIATLTSAKFGKHFSAGAIVVQLGQGDGTFKVSTVNLAAGKATAIVAGDFNKDGKHDLAIAGVDGKSGKTQVTVLLGDGAGKFTAQATQNVGTLPVANLTAGDLDGDGAADLVSFTDTKVYASLNDGAGKLATAIQQDNPLATGVPAAIGDLDNDGRADLIGVSGDGIFLNRWFIAQKQFLQNVPIVLTSTIPLAGTRIAVGDVNGDGKNDLLAIGDDSVGVALQTTQPGQDPTFAAWVKTTDDGLDADKTLVGDVDGDGKADLVTPANKLGFLTRARLVLISNGDGTFHKLVIPGPGNGHGHGDDDDDDDDDDHDDHDD
jgi:hypothetical protein